MALNVGPSVGYEPRKRLLYFYTSCQIGTSPNVCDWLAKVWFGTFFHNHTVFY